MTLDTYSHLVEDRLDEVGTAIIDVAAIKVTAEPRVNALPECPR